MNRSKERACEGKKAYPDEMVARGHLVGFVRSNRFEKWEMKPYRCPHCHLWHLGHRSKKEQNFVKQIEMGKPTPKLA